MLYIIQIALFFKCFNFKFKECENDATVATDAIDATDAIEEKQMK